MPERPKQGEFPPYFQKYIDKVQGENLTEVIANHSASIIQFYTNLPEDKATFAYAEGKWTVNEVLQHVIDAERIFSYRALRISRKDQTSLPGFDEDAFAANSFANNRTITSLKNEFIAVRHATTLLLQSFNKEHLEQTGTASNVHITTNAIAYIIYGHLLHHQQILQERYL